MYHHFDYHDHNIEYNDHNNDCNDRHIKYCNDYNDEILKIS